MSAKQRPTAVQSVCQAIQLRSRMLIASRASLLMDDDLLFTRLGPGLLKPAMVFVGHVEAQPITSWFAHGRHDHGDFDAIARRHVFVEQSATEDAHELIPWAKDDHADMGSGQLVGAEAPGSGADVANLHLE